MTDDQILSVAKVVRDGGHWNQLDIIRFARYISAIERDLCSEVVMEMDGGKSIADAIRARGNA